MPGYTLTSDFEASRSNDAFFAWHTGRVREMGGRLYLAKDSAMTPAQFEGMYPRIAEWREVARRLDPGNRFTSDLAARLGIKPW
jgi:decaprenylphospho-beta-D-ribofuranose 2-oxidase